MVTKIPSMSGSNLVNDDTCLQIGGTLCLLTIQYFDLPSNFQLGRDPWGGQPDYPCLLHLRDQLETLQNSPRNLCRRGTRVLQVQVDINLCSP